MCLERHLGLVTAPLKCFTDKHSITRRTIAEKIEHGDSTVFNFIQMKNGKHNRKAGRSIILKKRQLHAIDRPALSENQSAATITRNLGLIVNPHRVQQILSTQSYVEYSEG